MKRLVLVAVILGAVALGCKMAGIGSTSSPANGLANAAASPAADNSGGQPSGDARQAVVDASKKFIDQKAFQAVMNTTGDKPTETRLEYVAPDRFHIVNGTSVESVIIGKTAYVKLNGKWQKFPSEMGKSIASMRDAFTDEGLKSLKDVSFESNDLVDGVPASVYAYKSSTPKDGTSYRSKIWISNTSGLPMKIEVDYEGSTLKHMTTVYSYDEGVSIDPPVE